MEAAGSQRKRTRAHAAPMDRHQQRHRQLFMNKRDKKRLTTYTALAAAGVISQYLLLFAPIHEIGHIIGGLFSGVDVISVNYSSRSTTISFPVFQG